MKKRYLPLAFAFALSLTTHAALCMDEKEETSSLPSKSEPNNNYAYHSGGYTHVPGGMWKDTDKFFLGAHMGYGVGRAKSSIDLNEAFKTPDVPEKL